VVSNLQNPGPTIDAINSSWIVPAVGSSVTDTYSAVWVGVGGGGQLDNDNSLIQTGTEQDFVGGQAYYSAWYEMLPNYSITIENMTISPGDSIQVQISLINPANNLWSISLADLTNGQSFHQDFNYSSKQLSAEWVVERPEVNNQLSNLADFGSLNFTNCYATIANATGSITNFPDSSMGMSDEIIGNVSVQLVNVSALSNNGTQFNVTYTAGQ